MNAEDMKKSIDRAVEKYGPDIEFMVHGPGQDGLFLSGFGVECNWYAGDMTLGDGRKLRVCFMHGLPIQHENEKGVRFPVITGAFPLHHRLMKKGEADF